jgi:predicted nucleic-acid-binding Zn-ribbon protein
MQACLFMNLVPLSSRFFFNSGPKKTLSLSLNLKCDQQTHKENDASNYGINLKKIIQQISHNNFSDVCQISNCKYSK